MWILLPPQLYDQRSTLALTKLQQPSGVVQCTLQRPLLVDREAQVVQDVDAIHLGGRLSLVQLPQGLSHPQLGVVVVGLRVRHPAQVEAVGHRQHGPLGRVQGPAWREGGQAYAVSFIIEWLVFFELQVASVKKGEKNSCAGI